MHLDLKALGFGMHIRGKEKIHLSSKSAACFFFFGCTVVKWLHTEATAPCNASGGVVFFNFYFIY